MAEIISGTVRSGTLAKLVLSIFAHGQFDRIASILVERLHTAKQLRLDKALCLKADEGAQLLGMLVANGQVKIFIAQLPSLANRLKHHLKYNRPGPWTGLVDRLQNRLRNADAATRALRSVGSYIDERVFTKLSDGCLLMRRGRSRTRR